MTPREAIRKAVAAAGGQSALARAIGVKQPTVWLWCNDTDKGCGAEYALAIERETGVSRHDLRPDLYPRDNLAALDAEDAA